MKNTAIPDLFTWSVHQADRRIDFNGFYWRRESGGVLIDPMPIDARQLEVVDGKVDWILLTNADHLRAAAALREHFGARIVAPATDRAALAGAPVDAWFGPNEPLPPALANDVEVGWICGGKTTAEAALYLRPIRAVLFGDAVRSHATGVLRLLPDEKLTDRARLIRDVRALAQWNFTAVLLGDGDSLFTGAKSAFLDFVREL